MIKKLSVSNYALKDNLHISFPEGFSILTGETGAGKSIILGALSLATGQRADLSSLRDKGKKCVVEMLVDIEKYGLEGFFEENDIDYDPQTIIRREILPSGKSRAFVNDTPVLLDVLGELSSRLVDIHSQHQSLMLSKHAYRINVLDSYSGDNVPFTLYSSALEKYNGVKESLSALYMKREGLSASGDYNRFVLSELRAAKLREGEQEELEELQSRLSNIQGIKEALFIADTHFNEEQYGILSRLSAARAALAPVMRYMPEEADIENRLESAYLELKDISSEVSSILSGTDDDPGLLERTSSRLDVIYTLLRKHNAPDVASLLEMEKRLGGEVSGLENIDEEITATEKELALAEKELSEAADGLSHARREAANELSSSMSAVIRELGMPNAVFTIAVSHCGHFRDNGADDISFLFSANMGQEPAPVEKVASGGELSRIMLALKYSLALKTRMPAIIFDEIDSGVSGDMADRMGRIMQDMSSGMQVIAITHLPQIASRGDAHFKVYKSEADGVTSSGIAELSAEERVVELASMISGRDIGASAIEHARNLIRSNARHED